VTQAAATGCRATWTVASSWPGGYQAAVEVTNLGAAVTSWTLTWTAPSSDTVTQAWNATVTQDGSRVTARNAAYNGTLGTGASVSLGLIGSGSGSAPTNFALGGVACTGTVSPGSPSASPTIPNTSPSPTATTSPRPTATATSSPSPAPTTPPPTSSPSPTTAPTTPPPASAPGTSPTWGSALPPAGAQLSRAYTQLQTAQASGYSPKSGECSVEVHARYWTYGPDGKVYPTWHPVRDASGCSFGHEHGDDPRPSDLYSSVGWPAFGYTSEVLAGSASESSHRHEDHVGHKVLVVNNQNVIQGDNGTSFFPPSGSTIATCDTYLKFHQGTHSPDAFTNNLHELLLDLSCTQNGQTQSVSYKALMPLGRPGGFNSTDCPGPNLGSRFTSVGTAVPADSPSDTRSLGRLLTASDCVQAIRDGKTHFEVIENRDIPFDTNDLHEFWFGTARLEGAGVSFNLSPLFYVLNPSRYYDPAASNRLSRSVDLCYNGIRGSYCDQVRSQSGTVTWDDPRSPFKGTLREFRPGSFSLSTSGSGTVYTDALGRNPSTTPFAGSVAQKFSGSTSSTLFVRGATRDYATSTVHAPN